MKKEIAYIQLSYFLYEYFHQPNATYNVILYLVDINMLLYIYIF